MNKLIHGTKPRKGNQLRMEYPCIISQEYKFYKQF